MKMTRNGHQILKVYRNAYQVDANNRNKGKKNL